MSARRCVRDVFGSDEISLDEAKIATVQKASVRLDDDV
jgi:hypothetical protein